MIPNAKKTIERSEQKSTAEETIKSELALLVNRFMNILPNQTSFNHLSSNEYPEVIEVIIEELEKKGYNVNKIPELSDDNFILINIAWSK